MTSTQACAAAWLTAVVVMSAGCAARARPDVAGQDANGTTVASGAPTAPSAVTTSDGSAAVGPQDRAEQARARCATDGTSAVLDNGWADHAADLELLRAYASTSASLQAWMGSDRKSNPTTTAPGEGADLVAICYFAGQFSVPVPQPPPAPGQPDDPAAQTLVGITLSPQGTAELLMVGDGRDIDLDQYHSGEG